MKTFRPLLTFFGVLFTCIGYANNLDGIRFTHIGLEEGLSHCTIFGINQDKEGNLWFATYDGVNKYDGYNFTVYRHPYACDSSFITIFFIKIIRESILVPIIKRKTLSGTNPYSTGIINCYTATNE